MLIADHFHYQTEVYDTALEAWDDLEKYLKSTADGYTLWMRNSPEVSYDYDFDTKKKTYRGFVRFSRWGEKIDGTTINIPSLGNLE